MNRIKTLIIITSTVLLISCNKEIADLDLYFSQAKNIPARPIDPLPEINTPEIFIYNAIELRDPFSNDLQMSDEPNSDGTEVVDGPGPDLSRRKEILENFPLDALYMVGTYMQGEDYWGLIEDPEGGIYRVSLTQHMGQNYGEIVMINEDQIEVSEWVSDGLGGWMKREASIALREE